MNVRVLTRGNDVRLQIRASDEGAKKIIEESMVHLKDRLASQNLTLGRVELSVGQLGQQAATGQEAKGDNGQQFQQNPGQQDWTQGSANQTSQGSTHGQGGGNSGRWSEDGSDSFGRQGASRAQSASAALQAMGAAGSARQRTYSESGRIDVTA
jgi:hypothetical protein